MKENTKFHEWVCGRSPRLGEKNVKIGLW